MTSEIDKLLRTITQALSQAEPSSPELAAVLEATGLDGRSVAISAREKLRQWQVAPDLTTEERERIRQGLEGLPEF